jgi:hypothetical protein
LRLSKDVATVAVGEGAVLFDSNGKMNGVIEMKDDGESKEATIIFGVYRCIL